MYVFFLMKIGFILLIAILFLSPNIVDSHIIHDNTSDYALECIVYAPVCFSMAFKDIKENSITESNPRHLDISRHL